MKKMLKHYLSGVALELNTTLIAKKRYDLNDKMSLFIDKLQEHKWIKCWKLLRQIKRELA